MSTDLINQKDLANLKEQLTRMPKDNDRLKLIQRAAESFYFTSIQVKQLVDVQHFGDAKNQTAILLHPRLKDPENFEKNILSCFKFKEDIDEIRAAVGL